MEELIAHVNWTAVIVGAVVSYLLGSLWYSKKLFGPKWAEGAGVSMDETSGVPVAAMVMQAIGTFLLAWVVGITAAANELLTIILIVATVIVLHLASAMFCQKNAYAIRTETGFILTMTVIMIVSQGIF